jgi:hypothetical protein
MVAGVDVVLTISGKQHTEVVVFESFRFVSQSGSKPDVKIALADEPLQFKGDLEFVNELKEFIPPDLFGDGASLDVNLCQSFMNT